MRQPLYPWGKSFQYTLNTRQGGPLGRSVNFGEEINVLSLPGLEPQIIQPVA